MNDLIDLQKLNGFFLEASAQLSQMRKESTPKDYVRSIFTNDVKLIKRVAPSLFKSFYEEIKVYQRFGFIYFFKSKQHINAEEKLIIHGGAKVLIISAVHPYSDFFKPGKVISLKKNDIFNIPYSMMSGNFIAVSFDESGTYSY